MKYKYDYTSASGDSSFGYFFKRLKEVYIENGWELIQVIDIDEYKYFVIRKAIQKSIWKKLADYARKFRQ